MARLNPNWISLLAHLTSILFKGKAQTADGDCATTITVRRNTALTATLRKPFWIKCPVKYCDEEPKVIWSQHHEIMTWVPLNESHQFSITKGMPTSNNTFVSFLNFKAISKQDGGQYRCETTGLTLTIGHTINVSVSDGILEMNDSVTEINSSSSATKTPNHAWSQYVYICTGIVTMVIIVMLVSLLSVYDCKRPRKENKQKQQVQNTVIQLSPLLSPCPDAPEHDGTDIVFPPNHVQSRECNPNALTSHASLQIPAEGPGHWKSSKKQEFALGARTGVQESSRPYGLTQLLYASLDHLSPRESSTINAHCLSEVSYCEYASVRIS